MQTQTEKVSFRLAPEFAKLLEQQAAKDGKSVGDCARRILIRALTDSEHTEFRAEMRTELEKLQTNFKEDLKKMRGDLATLGGHLLVKVAKEKPSEAETWVREHLAP